MHEPISHQATGMRRASPIGAGSIISALSRISCLPLAVFGGRADASTGGPAAGSLSRPDTGSAGPSSRNWSSQPMADVIASSFLTLVFMAHTSEAAHMAAVRLF